MEYEKSKLVGATWLRTKEVARYLGTTVGAVKNLTFRRILVPRKLGRSNYYKKEEIDRMLELSVRKYASH